MYKKNNLFYTNFRGKMKMALSCFCLYGLFPWITKLLVRDRNQFMVILLKAFRELYASPSFFLPSLEFFPLAISSKTLERFHDLDNWVPLHFFWNLRSMTESRSTQGSQPTDYKRNSRLEHRFCTEVTYDTIPAPPFISLRKPFSDPVC